MTQHDQNIANGSGSAVRADINDALSALFSNSSGASEPTTTTAYMLWADTTNNVMKLRNAADSGWIELFTIGKQGLVDQSGITVYSLTTGSANTYTATLAPAPTALSAGQIVNVKIHAANTGASTINVNSLGAKNIVKPGGEPLRAGDLPDSAMVSLLYSGTTFHLVGARISQDANSVGGPPPFWHSVTQIKIPAGCWVVDSSGSRRIQTTSELTVAITSAGANGLDTGSEANDTQYYLHLCEGSSGVCGLLSTSSSSPTLPSGYNSYRGLLPLVQYNNSSGDFIAWQVSGWGARNIQVTYLKLTDQTIDSAISSANTSTWVETTNLSKFVPSFADAAYVCASPNTTGGTINFSKDGSVYGVQNGVASFGTAGAILAPRLINLNSNNEIEVATDNQPFALYCSEYKVVNW